LIISRGPDATAQAVIRPSGAIARELGQGALAQGTLSRT